MIYPNNYHLFIEVQNGYVPSLSYFKALVIYQFPKETRLIPYAIKQIENNLYHLTFRAPKKEEMVGISKELCNYHIDTVKFELITGKESIMDIDDITRIEFEYDNNEVTVGLELGISTEEHTDFTLKADNEIYEVPEV